MARTPPTRSRLFPSLRPLLLATLGLLLVSACSSGGGCGEGCNGFEQKSFPAKHNDKTVPRLGQVRLAESGIGFIEKQVPTLIDQFLDQGLSFCVPKTKVERELDVAGFPILEGNVEACGANEMCSSGEKGCQTDLAIEGVDIQPKPNKDRLDVKVTVGELNEVLPVDITAGAFTGTLTSECKVDLHKDGEDNDVPGVVKATVPVKFRINQQSPTKGLSIRLGNLDPDLSELAFDIDSRGGVGNDIGCGTVDVIKPLVRGLIVDRVKGTLNDTIQKTVKSQLCQNCGKHVGPSCPKQSKCSDIDGDAKICKWKSQDKCVPRTLGVEGRLKANALLSGLLDGRAGAVDLMAKAADLGDVENKGVSLGLRAGFQPSSLSSCVPADGSRRPDLSDIPEASEILTNTHPTSGDPFMLGVGLHKRMLEHAAWGLWASGGLCLRVGANSNIGGNATGLLTTGSLGLLLPGLEKLTNRDGPVYVRISPQTPPKIALGNNEITKKDDSYEIDDPLVTLQWDDLDVHFYGFIQDRYTRLFTLRTDVRVPVGVTTQGSKLVPAIGDLSDAAQNLRVRNHRILKKNAQQLESLIPSLLGQALSQVGSLSNPIDLPTFGGFKLALDDEDITSIDDPAMIALYADLASTGNMQMQSLTLPPRPTIEAKLVQLGSPSAEGLPQSAVRLEMSAERFSQSPMAGAGELEYSYRVDDGVWSMFTRSEQFVIDDPILALPGEHEVEVRARPAGQPAALSEPVETTVRIDYRPPEVEAFRDGATLEVEADDVVDSTSDIDYRYRLVDDGTPIGSWSEWRNHADVPLEETLSEVEAELPLTVVSQARDRSGRVGGTTYTLERPLEDRGASPRTSSNGSHVAPAEAGGCSTTGGGTSGGGTTWPLAALCALGLGAWFRRRRRDLSETDDDGGARWMGLALLLLVLAPLGGACSSDLSSQKSNKNACGKDCKVNEVCKSGKCVPKNCSSNADCPDGAYCIENTCRSTSCNSDADCPCGGDTQGVCLDGTCTCENFCSDGCGDGSYCCYQDNSCKSYPDPCKNKSCGPGLKPTVVDQGDADNKSCSVSGGTCKCASKEPVDLKWYGSHASIASNNGVTAVSAYNRGWGDLMVGVLGDELEPTWYFAAGVPEDGEIVGDPNGPRGGTDDFGDKVGTHTAIAVDTSGRLHVFYRTVDSGILKYARGTEGSDGYTFETIEIDGQGETGYYTSAAVRGGVVHASYGVQSIETSDGERTQLRHVSFPVDASLGDLSPTPTAIYGSAPANPCDTECDDEVCFAEAGTCAAPDDSCTGGGSSPDAGRPSMDAGTPTADAGSSSSESANCGNGEACRNGSCRETYTPPPAPGHRLMTGLYTETIPAGSGVYVVFYDRISKRVGWISRQSGSWSEATFLDAESGPYASGAVKGGELHLAYMDPESRSLRYRAPDGTTSVLVDGVRKGGGGHLRAEIGQNVDLEVQSGRLTATFQDATSQELKMAKRTGNGGWQVQTLASPEQDGSYTGVRGFYSGMAGGVTVDFVIDQETSDAPKGFLEFHQVP